MFVRTSGIDRYELGDLAGTNFVEYFGGIIDL